MAIRNRFPSQQSKSSSDKHNVNNEIRAQRVRLIGAAGEQLGVLITSEAIRIAEDAGLDLVEVSPNSDPPVCRILDYGKLKYREQKKAAEARKRSVTQTVKELRIRYNTDKHDLETKVRKARDFLAEGDRVKFSMRFRGREVVYEALGRETFDKIVESLSDVSVIEEQQPLMGNRMSISLAPKPKGSA